MTHNSRGDIIGIYNGDGILRAQYKYDAWGNVLSVTDENGNAITSATHVGNLNPFRYRGYYYDAESGFYYLMSRYYDPVTHRFINADGYFKAGNGILDFNMSAYCKNNPIAYSDPTGTITLYQLLENLTFSETCNYNIDLITQLQKAGCDWDDEIPLIFNYETIPIAFGSVKVNNYKGWSWRIDANPYSKIHIHIYKGNKEYSQNIDGSPHDGSTGSPPNSIKKHLKEQNIWDWDSKTQTYNMNKDLEMMQIIAQHPLAGVPLGVTPSSFTLPQFSSFVSGYYFSIPGYGIIL